MPKQYGSAERGTLFTLFRENRDMPNPELRNNYKIELDPKGRKRLNQDGLLETSTAKRPYVHRITEAGVRWCVDELGQIVPDSRSGPTIRALCEILRDLIHEIQQGGGRIIDLLGPADLESLIRAAYAELQTKPQDWVRLAWLRAKLNGADRDEVDQTLLAMTRTGLVHLAPESDQRAVTDADRAAAIRIGIEDKHLVAIEES